MARKLDGSYITANTITTTQLATSVVSQLSSGGGPKVKSLIYPGNDTAANTAGGQTVYVLGSGFASNAQILINGSVVPSQSFISASNIGFTTPVLSTGTYPVYVINPEDGGTAILYPGLLISGDPTWVTSAGSLSSSQDEASAWNFSLSATGDAPITYALAAGNTLPSGVTLAANGLISGTISSPSGVSTTYNFSVVATDAQNQDSTRAFSVTTSSGEGVLFANNVLLIHADGTNNQNNHTFLDSSNNNFTITRFGNATQGSFSPFSQTGWSNYLDGSGDSFTLSSTSLNLGSFDFTVEAWVQTTSTGEQCIVGSIANSNGGGAWMFNLNYNSNKLRFYCRYGGGTALDYQAGSGTFPTNKWTHIAATRSGSNLRLFIDGTQVGSTSTTLSTNSLDNATTSYYIGRTTDGASQFTGYISNLRVIKGNALYTSNFTPSTVALTAVANTQLLTCQSNRFIDNSTNAFALTRNGDVSVQAFSPFAPTTAYSTANVGGSGYFDGTGDYLTTLANSAAIGTSAYTFETWAYFNSVSGQNGVINAFNNSDGSKFALRLTRFTGADYLVLLESYPTGSTGWVFPQWIAKQWYHYVVVRNASNQTTCWVNGVRSTSGILTNAVASANYAPIDGVQVASGPGNSIDGYLSGTRLVIGSALYDVNSSTISVPTSPPTNITNTSLLLNFTNAGIFDQTAQNILETFGSDAKVSTAQYKYGTGSIYLNGDNNYLTSRASNLYSFGSGDFTVEMWLYVSSSGSNQCVIDFRNAGDTNGIFLRSTSSTNFEIRIGNSSIHTFTATAGQFNHIAIVRSSGTIKSFVNGVETGSTSNSTNLTSQGPLYINRFYDLAAGIVGYIDDLRITRGYARYTSNFTPPTSALKDK